MTNDDWYDKWWLIWHSPHHVLVSALGEHGDASLPHRKSYWECHLEHLIFFNLNWSGELKFTS